MSDDRNLANKYRPQVFDDLAVLGVCLYVSCKYIAEAISKFTAILNEKKLLAKKENSNDTAGNK